MIIRLKQPIASVTSMLTTQPYKKVDAEDAIVINEEVKYPEICSKTKRWTVDTYW